jgi:hypothetical protein
LPSFSLVRSSSKALAALLRPVAIDLRMDMLRWLTTLSEW